MKCRGCGCSDFNACVIDGVPCHWVENDLCSVCARAATTRIPATGNPQIDELAAKTINSRQSRMTGAMTVPEWIHGLDLERASPKRLAEAMEKLYWIRASEYPETSAGTYAAMALIDKIQTVVENRGLVITFGKNGSGPRTVHGGNVPPVRIQAPTL